MQGCHRCSGHSVGCGQRPLHRMSAISCNKLKKDDILCDLPGHTISHGMDKHQPCINLVPECGIRAFDVNFMLLQ